MPALWFLPSGVFSWLDRTPVPLADAALFRRNPLLTTGNMALDPDLRLGLSPLLLSMAERATKVLSRLAEVEMLLREVWP